MSLCLTNRRLDDIRKKQENADTVERTLNAERYRVRAQEESQGYNVVNSPLLLAQADARARGLDITVARDSDGGNLYKIKGVNSEVIVDDISSIASYLEQFQPAQPGDVPEEPDEEAERSFGWKAFDFVKDQFIGDNLISTAVKTGSWFVPGFGTAKLVFIGGKLATKTAFRLLSNEPTIVRAIANPVQKLIAFVDEAAKLRPSLIEARAIKQSGRVQEVERAIQRGQGGGTAALDRARGALRGEQSDIAINPHVLTRLADDLVVPRGQSIKTAIEKAPRVKLGDFTLNERDQLANLVLSAKVPWETKVQASVILSKVTQLHKIPTEHEVGVLKSVFGNEFASSFNKLIPLRKQLQDTLIDAINVPKSLKSSFDLSAPLRQGLLQATTHPIRFAQASKDMVKALVSPKYAAQIDEQIRFGELAQLRGKAGLAYSSEILPGSFEEAFPSKLAGSIPGVGASQRAYTTFLNKLRSDIFDDQVLLWRKQGMRVDMNDYRSLANWVNVATGRGNLGAFAQHKGALNMVFFSPAFFLSRFQAPLALVTSTPAVRGLVARDIVATAGAIGGMATLLAQHDGVTVNTDPNSSDFLKAKIGSTRIDMGAGFTQVFRLLWQMASSQKTSVGSGRTYDVNREEVVVNFIKSKFSPSAGVVTDLAFNETFLGEDFRVPDLATSDQIKERLAPLFLLDLQEALDVEGVSGLALSSASFFGFGVQSFQGLNDLRMQTFKELYPGQEYQQVLSQRGRGLFRELDTHERVRDELTRLESTGEIRNKEYIDGARQKWQEDNRDAEKELRADIDAGLLTGDGLRTRLTNYLQNRRTRADTLFGNLSAEIEADQTGVPIADMLATEYYSADLPFDRVLQRYEYKERDEMRLDVLERARKAAVPLNYILGNGPGSFRGNRSEDPLVHRFLIRRENDFDSMKEYWAIDDEIRADNDGINKVLAELRITENQGGTPDEIKRIKNSGLFKSYQKQLTRQREFLRFENPVLDARLFFWGHSNSTLTAEADDILEELKESLITGIDNPL